jgi:hypothetical protein
VRTLLYGTLLPGPTSAAAARDVMRAVRDAGHETGIHCYDHVRWQDGVAGATRSGRAAAGARVRALRDHHAGAPAHARRRGLADERARAAAHAALGFDYCSDGRGYAPHLPVWRGELIRCPQIPTTLPTLDELIGTDGIDLDNVADHVLALTEQPPYAGAPVFTLHAELEGMLLAPVLDRLIAGWKARATRPGRCEASTRTSSRWRCRAARWATARCPGRSGTLLVQERGVPRRRRCRRCGLRLRSHSPTKGHAMVTATKVVDFTAVSTDGTFRLSTHQGHPVVLYFYPKDNTPAAPPRAPRSVTSTTGSRKRARWSWACRAIR